jgi:hypothetical protein
MTDDDQAHIKRDMARLADSMPPNTPVLGPDDDTSKYGEGQRLMIAYNIGWRGKLTNKNAQEYAEGWRTMRAKHPAATFCPIVAGYDEDPRELWEIPEVVKYVRQFAELAGIKKPSDLPRDPLGHLFTFFGAMGVWGEAAKVQATAPMPFGDVGQA